MIRKALTRIHDWFAGSGRTHEDAWGEALKQWQAERDREEEMVRTGQGVWVRAGEVSPFVNVSGRLYRDKRGRVHRFYDVTQFRNDPPAEWFFPRCS